MYSSIKTDEQRCRICNDKIDSLSSLFFENECICQSCREQFILHRRAYKINGIWIYVLYEYNEFLERLLFRFKEQRDIALKEVFLHDCYSLFKKITKYHSICVMPSSDFSRYQRGFEPNIEILYQSNVYSPLYKNSNIKQSESKNREHIKNVICRKELYTIPSSICLFDDVCTSMNTLQCGIRLLNPEKIFLLSAHPLCIQGKSMEKQKRF